MKAHNQNEPRGRSAHPMLLSLMRAEYVIQRAMRGEGPRQPGSFLGERSGVEVAISDEDIVVALDHRTAVRLIPDKDIKQIVGLSTDGLRMRTVREIAELLGKSRSSVHRMQHLGLEMVAALLTLVVRKRLEDEEAKQRSNAYAA